MPGMNPSTPTSRKTTPITRAAFWTAVRPVVAVVAGARAVDKTSSVETSELSALERVSGRTPRRLEAPATCAGGTRATTRPTCGQTRQATASGGARSAASGALHRLVLGRDHD